MSEEKKKHPGGRPTKYNAQFHPLLAESLARVGLTDDQMSEKLGITKQTLNNWKREYPEFFSSLKKGKSDPDDLVEASLFRRALGYKTNEVTRERIADTGQKVRHGGESKLTEKDWEYAISAFSGTCAYCGTGKRMTKDHVIPLHSGGELARDNVVPACGKCNSAKQDRPMEEWFREQKFFTEEKLANIKAYLAEMKKAAQAEPELVVTKIVTKEVPPDTTAAIYWTKNRRPDRWRDKQNVELTGKDGEQLPISFTFVADNAEKPNAGNTTK